MSFEHHNPQYHEFKIHDLMLSDEIRTETYKRAIEENISKGDVVIDFGTGTGILAIFAAKAGACKVYAIEKTSIINLAKKLAKDNGVENVIEFIQANAKDVKLPEKVDVIISEWLGVFVFQENMLPDLLLLRDKFLKQKGKLLPEKIDLFIAPVTTPKNHCEIVSKWEKNIYDLNLKRLAVQQSRKEHLIDLSDQEIIAIPQKIFELNLYTSAHTNETRYRVKKKFQITRDVSCHGLGGWFSAYFPGTEVLDTSPGKSQTCWQQAFFPLEVPINIKQDQEIEVQFSVSIDAENTQLAHFDWQLALSVRK